LRPAQKALAAEVVRDLHGQEALDTALAITEALFRGRLQELTPKQRHQAVAPMEKMEIAANLPLEDVLVQTGIAKSKREAREWTKGNSIAINGVKVTDPMHIVGADDMYADDCVILKKGKKNQYCLHLV